MTAPRISDELAAFLESGVSIVVATRDGALRPDGAMACAVKVHDDRGAITLYLYEQAAAEMAPNLAVCPAIAVNFDRPTTHRACQVKGDVVATRAAAASERALVERQMDGFADELDAIGLPREATVAWPRWPCVALEVRVRHLFEQTPGPGTGGPLK